MKYNINMKATKSNSFKNTKNFTFIVVLIFLSGLFINSTIMAQGRANKWIFNGFNIHFDKDSTRIVANSLSDLNTWGYTPICDTLGNLLMYTNGYRVWDKNGNLMLNGDSIQMPDPSFYRALNSVIIPKPENPNVYYIFTANPYYYLSGLFCSEIDMTLNGGLGEVINKQIKLQDSTTNKITAVYHKNQKDVWVITHKHGTNSYYSFLITKNGISSTPVESTGTKSFSECWHGQLKASPDGEKIVSAYSEDFHSGGGFDLLSFNSETGKLHTPMSFMDLSKHCYGAEFSSDATKLYTIESSSSNGLYQYDLSQFNFNDIINSRKLLINPDMSLHVMQLAPDGKIYITKRGLALYFGIINSPNEVGWDCDAKENGLYLNGEETSEVSTPYYIQNYFIKTSPETGIGMVKKVEIAGIKIYPNPASDYVKIEEVGKKTQLTYSIADLSGSLLLQGILHANEDLNLQYLEPGLYIMRLENSNGKTYIIKIIKQ